MDSKHLIGKRSEDMRRKEELAARPQFLLRGFLPLLLTSTLLQLNIPPIFEMFKIFQIFILHILHQSIKKIDFLITQSI